MSRHGICEARVGSVPPETDTTNALAVATAVMPARVWVIAGFAGTAKKMSLSVAVGQCVLHRSSTHDMPGSNCARARFTQSCVPAKRGSRCSWPRGPLFWSLSKEVS
jgi:hypothetical protein